MAPRRGPTSEREYLDHRHPRQPRYGHQRRSGDIVWEVESTLPYDAERLETGAESESGQSARELGLESRTVTEDDGGTGEFGIDLFAFLGGIVESILPIESITRSSSLRRSGWRNYSRRDRRRTPVGLTWVGLEIRWMLRDAGIRFRLPVSRERE